MSSLIESWLLDNNFWKTDQVSWCAPIKMTQKPWNPGARITITTNLFTSQLAYFFAGSVLFQFLLILEKYPFCPHAYVILLYLSHHWVTTSFCWCPPMEKHSIIICFKTLLTDYFHQSVFFFRKAPARIDNLYFPESNLIQSFQPWVQKK